MSIRESTVLSTFVDLSTQSAYVLDRFASEREPMGRGDRIILPDLGALTIYRDASVARQAGARNTPNTLVNELELIVDEEPWIPMQMRNTDSTFNLSGNWDQQVGKQAFIQLENLLDAIVVDDYVVGELCWLASGVTTYHFNVDGDGVQPKDFLEARGIALRQPGTQSENLLFILDSLCGSAVMDFKGWQNLPSATSLGPKTLGTLYGIEVVQTQSTRLSKQFDIATAAVAANVLTLTFASNPGLVVGDLLRTTGLQATYDLLVATPIDTVSANGLSITLQHAGADDADIDAAGTGVAISAAAHNLLVDRSMIHQAKTKVPYLRTVADPDTSGNIVQVVALLGFIGRVGRAFAIKSPEFSID
jgi:hypothetical protein